MTTAVLLRILQSFGATVILIAQGGKSIPVDTDVIENIDFLYKLLKDNNENLIVSGDVNRTLILQ